MIQLVNPFTKDVYKEIELENTSITRSKIESAEKAFQSWKTTSFDERAKALKHIADHLVKEKDPLAETMTQEMGKPIAQAKAEVEKCAWVCNFYADNGAKFLADKNISTDASNSYVTYQPYGVILAIMPWNYPLWQVFRFLAPAIMCGNTALLKHAPNTFQSAKNIAEVLEKAGLPKNVFQNLFIDVDQVEDVIADPVVKAVSFTGSTTAGSKVAQLAGKYLKKSVLELGGSNALVVFKDADLDQTAKTCIQARFQNNGQSCIAGKRLFIQADIYDTFIQKLINQVKQLKIGDPLDKDTYISVMARQDLANELKNQLDDALQKGAQLIYGGKQDGTYFEPSIISNCNDSMKVMQEETFGPLLAIEKFNEESKIAHQAKATPYALGCSIFTKDDNIINKMLRDIREPAIFINELVKSDPRLPFGGFKHSGYGRELSAEGIREFSLIQTIYEK